MLTPFRQVSAVLLALVLVALAISGSSADGRRGPRPCPGQNIEPARGIEPNYRAALECLFNRERKRLGFSKLNRSAKIDRAAKYLLLHEIRCHCIPDLDRALRKAGLGSSGLYSAYIGISYAEAASPIDLWDSQLGSNGPFYSHAWNKMGVGVLIKPRLDYRTSTTIIVTR